MPTVSDFRAGTNDAVVHMYDTHVCGKTEIRTCDVCLTTTAPHAEFRTSGYACTTCSAVACSPCIDGRASATDRLKYMHSCFTCKQPQNNLERCIVCAERVDIANSAMFLDVLRDPSCAELRTCAGTKEFTACASSIDAFLDRQLSMFQTHAHVPRALQTAVASWKMWLCTLPYSARPISALVLEGGVLLNNLHRYLRWTYSVGCVCAACESHDMLTYCRSCTMLVRKDSVAGELCQHCRGRYVNPYGSPPPSSPVCGL